MMGECVEIHGDTWRYMEIHGDTWRYVEIRGNAWKYVEMADGLKRSLEVVIWAAPEQQTTNNISKARHTVVSLPAIQEKGLPV